MKVEQIYTGCLAHGAYYIESNGEAAIIDPLREVDNYIRKAEQDNASIKYVFETHFHADFVSGHLDLAAKTGATIVYGPTAEPSFPAHIAKDGEIFKIGAISIQALHTPGHTLESTCYLLKDEQGKDIGLFSGDTLFIGDVGRPDLAQKLVKELTEEKLARLLFHSLRNKIMPLDGGIIVYPAHGAGSACGKFMSSETTDTLAHQKATNYALRENMTEDEFLKELLSGLVTPPGYFPMNVLMNKKGYDSIDEVLQRGLHPLSPAAFEAAANETAAVILDTRPAQQFAKNFIPNAINIGIDGNFATWVGTLIPDVKQEILLVTEPGREKEVITRLARVGYDHATGYLEGGMDAWIKAEKETDAIPSITVEEMEARLQQEKITVLDVRKNSEYVSEHLEGAENTPLDFINDEMAKLDRNKTYFVHCASGYRSMTFNSILRARGYDKLIDIKGGFQAIKASRKFKVTDYVQPTTLL